MLNGPYVMINQLIKFIGKDIHLDNSLTERNINPTKNDQDREF
jgi:hypothetical protein